VERLKTIIFAGESPWATAALFHLIEADFEAACSLRWLPHRVDVERIAALLTYRGNFRWLQRPHLLQDYLRPNGFVSAVPCASLPFDPGVIGEALARIAATMPHGEVSPDADDALHHSWFPGFLAVASTKDMLAALRAVARPLTDDQIGKVSSHWIEQGVALLQIAYLRDGDGATLARGFKDNNTLVNRLLTGLAQREVVPHLAPGLRRLLANGRPDDVDAQALGLALGTQRCPGDAARLLELLRQLPDSLDLALGVVRCGDAEAATKARLLYQPPRNLLGLLDSASWMTRLRELQSPRLLRQLARAFRRTAVVFTFDPYCSEPYHYGNLLKLLKTYALLADKEGAEHQLLQEMKRWAPFANEAGDGLERHLSQWSRPTTAADAWRRAARGEPGERAAALQTALNQTTERDRVEMMARWLGLLGAERSRLPEAGRLDLVKTAWSAGGCWGAAHSVETWLACCADFSPQQQQDIVREGPNRYSDFPDTSHPVWLLALDSGDDKKQRACLSLLEAWAEVNPGPLLYLLPHLFRWLKPARAEAIAHTLLARVDLQRLEVNELTAHLRRDEGHTMSYRVQQLLIRSLWPRLSWLVTRTIQNQLPVAPNTPGMRWIQEQINAVEAAMKQQETPS
jgi:hypothetical protein